MNGKNSSDISRPSQTDWENLARMTDDEIDTSDIPVLDDEFFERCRLGQREDGCGWQWADPHLNRHHRVELTSEDQLESGERDLWKWNFCYRWDGNGTV